MARKHKTIWDRHDDVLYGSQVSGKQGLFDYVTDRVSDLYTIADTKRTCVSEHDTGNDVGDRST